DAITIAAGTNTVLGDNGIVLRSAAGAITEVRTTDTTLGTGSNDGIASNGGTNIILGGVGDDTISASAGSNIILGDNGTVIVGGNVSSTVENLGGRDTITVGA